MVRDVRFITLNSSYRELQEMLVTSYLKTLALVESRGERRRLGELLLSVVTVTAFQFLITLWLKYKQHFKIVC